VAGGSTADIEHIANTASVHKIFGQKTFDVEPLMLIHTGAFMLKGHRRQAVAGELGEPGLGIHAWVEWNC